MRYGTILPEREVEGCLLDLAAPNTFLTIRYRVTITVDAFHPESNRGTMAFEVAGRRRHSDVCA